MTCYLRLHEVAVAVRPDEVARTDWELVARLWRRADGVDGRDAALDAMPVDLVELDDLAATDLAPYVGVVLSGRCDQQLLAADTDRLDSLLGRGGVVVFSGQLTHGWLPGARAFERTDRPAAPPQPARLASHQVFAGVSADDLGSSFLYADGWHEPPTTAEVIAWRADGTPGAYIDRGSSAGTVLVHGGANLLANATTTTAAARIVPQLIEWVAAEGGR